MQTAKGKQQECSATLRWVVDTAAWQPGAAEFDACLNVLSSEDQEAVLRYRFEDDRKRAIISRLLQRACVRRVCGVANKDVQLQRTKAKKPFTCNAKPAWAPNFNFNVSHEGNFTVLASEPLCVCGVDVAAPQQLRSARVTGLAAAIAGFQGQFAASEWALIQGLAGDEPSMEACFQRLWSLKEAFVKARGDGLGFEPLSRAEFSFVGGDLWSGEAQLSLDGQQQHRWNFELHAMGSRHWVCVARAPPEAVVDAYGAFKRTFQRPQLSDAEMHTALSAPSPPFEELHVRQLLPPDYIAAYMKAVATDEGL